ncbi:DUF6350 family protein [Gordonia sp. ABSL1-1]|uniref:cell division protein PerM n=1 Tax=Gordonia sp. ABSL1-1 TaxID=3053923 RepID=UPI0025734BE3|nr:DUF6350 family protein [Gordonia sp. ABSL1-1]MDL9937954.1 DUF6350 family protein [Gordonia sp. ABSL1-1]
MPTFTGTPTTENLASQLRRLRRSHRAQRSAPEGTGRQLVLVAFAVPAVALVVCSVVVLTVLLMADSGLSGVGTAVASCWLAIHQVPVTITGVTIGVLPLLPTLLVAVATARLAARAARSTGAGAGDVLPVVGAAVAGPTLITAMSLAVVMDGSTVLPIQSPNALTAFGYTAGIHLGAAFAGVAWTMRRRTGRRWLPADTRGVVLGCAAIVGLLAAATLLVVVRVIMRHGQIGELIATGNDFDGYLGLTLLSVLYIPNLIVGAAAMLVGSDAHIGMATMDLFTVQGGPLPPLPVLAILPDVPGAGRIGALGFVVPVAVAAVVMWRSRNRDLLAQVRSIGVAGAVAATGMALLTTMAGGELGEFGTVGIAVSTTAVYTLGWVVVVGLLGTLIYAFAPSSRAARETADDAWDDDADWDDDYVIVTDAELDDYGYADDDADDGADYEYDPDEYDPDEYDADGADATDDLDTDDLDTDERGRRNQPSPRIDYEDEHSS